MSESEYLQDQHSGHEAENDFDEIQWDAAANRLEKAYKEAKNKKTGEEISCPVCGVIFVKKCYQQKFCKTSCKDRYWNKVSPRGKFANLKLIRFRTI